MADAKGVAAQRKRGAEAKRLPPGSLWKHAKTGNAYFVITVAVEESSMRLLVIYAEEETGRTWSRPLSEWEEEVDVGGAKAKRFAPFVRK